MTAQNPIIVWFRNDLRLADHPALHAAAQLGPIIPLYILDESKAQTHPPGGAAKWFLREALRDLGDTLHAAGAPLILRRGDPAQILPELAQAAGAGGVMWSRCYEPHLRERDEKLEKALKQAGSQVDIHKSFLLFEPETIKTNSATPFKVFTPFAKACFSAPGPGDVLPAPRKLEGVEGIASDRLEDWQLVPKTATWPQGLAQAWHPTEQAAQKRLKHFIAKILPDYKNSRDRPDDDGTSRLSPYLHVGLISPRQLWHAAHDAAGHHPADAERFLLELLWREFSWHLLFHFPQITDQPLAESFAQFPWQTDAAGLKAWQQGRTGYPIIDAGMRQLWQTGWMHNRVRMIVASFLIKDLLIDWRAGMDWFRDTLVDADPGSNTASWQWVAGCGADAAPYFRVFNPTLQGQKFDPEGDYVRQFVPELAKLDAKYIHEPWIAPELALQQAGVVLGQTYPRPILDHDAARKRALEAFGKIKGDKKAEKPHKQKGLFD